MNAKQRAIEIYAEHITLASTDGRSFRKTVMDQLMLECQITLAAAATHYNNAKKGAPVEGLGRPAVPNTVRKPGANSKAKEELQADDDCFTVIELTKHAGQCIVGRCYSHLMQGDASEDFDSKIETWPTCEWVMIKGLGPLHGEEFKLSTTEQEVKRHPVVA